MKVPLPIPHTLAWCRKRSGFSQVEVARAVGVQSDGAVCMHELGRTAMTLERAFAYEALYGISVSELFSELRVKARRRVVSRTRSLRRDIATNGNMTERKKRTFDGVGSNPRIPMMPL